MAEEEEQDDKETPQHNPDDKQPKPEWDWEKRNRPDRGIERR